MSIAVSVIVPNLDSPLVGLTVDALRPQCGSSDIELLVVGKDRPGHLAAGDGFRFVETQQELSPAAARNEGVRQARGEAFLFTDADCVPRSDWVAKLRQALGSAPVVGGAVTFDRKANRWAVADNISAFHDLLEDRPAESDSPRPLGTLNLGVRREAWVRVGRFDEELITSEDFDWYLRARKQGLATAFEPAAVVQHAAVRDSREALIRHAEWYGRHFPVFRRLHPGVFDSGPTWRNRALFRLAAPLKAFGSALQIYRRHPMLGDAWRAFPAVVTFKRAWYRAVAEAWNR